jgi:hypothetical protein
MILRKYIDGFKNDLKVLGCKSTDFYFKEIAENGYVKTIEISFRDTPFRFTINKVPNQGNGVFAVNYIAFSPPNLINKPIHSFIYPDTIKSYLRNWIQEEINTYLEENSEDKVGLIPPPKNAKQWKPNLFKVNRTNGVNLSLSSGLFWTIFSLLIGGTFTLGLHFGQAKFDNEKIELYKSNQKLTKELNDKTMLLQKKVSESQLIIDSLHSFKTKVNTSKSLSE